MPDVVRRHVADQLGGRIDGRSRGVAEQLDGGHQHQRAEDPAGTHGERDAGADDVADPEQLRADLQRDVPAVVGLAEDLLRDVLEEGERLVAEREHRPETKAREDRLRGGAAFLARDEHLGAGGALGVHQRLRFLHDERPPQRDHHQDAEQAAQDGDQDHLADLHVVAEDEQGRHGDAHAEGDALAGAAGGLGDVVLQDGRAADAEHLGEGAEDGDGEHRDGDAGADGEADLEHQVHRAGAEEQAEERADDQRHRRQLGDVLLGRNERLVDLFLGGYRNPVDGRGAACLRLGCSGRHRHGSAHR